MTYFVHCLPQMKIIMASKETLRIQAVSLHSQGMKVAEIARVLGRSRQWVHKWINRYCDGSDGWERSLPTTPSRKASKISSELEDIVVSTRKRLIESPYMESGAFAIWHAIKAAGIAPPSVATINRILKKNGLTSRKVSYQKSDIEYPDPPLNMQIMDLIGPCYICGGQRFYLLTIISNDTRHAGVYPILSKSAADITNSVVSFWKSYTIPDFLQMDNELSFKGSNRHPRGLGLLLRTALSQNVTPVFIPVREPWRNGVIERFNQKVKDTLLMQKHKDFAELCRHASEFTDIHNNQHHYSTKEHKTPLQLDEELDGPIVKLPPDYQVEERPELDCFNLNEIHFIRLVRSDHIISVLNKDIEVNPELAYTYAKAILLINEHQLLICLDGMVKQSVEFIMPQI